MSRNGPVDVLVCPDEEGDSSPHPPCNFIGDDPDTTSSVNTVAPEPPESYLDISLSSMASHDAELDTLLPSFPQIVDQNQFLPDMFESLSPPLDDTDFPYASLSHNEGILDLFDLAS